jgi:capsular polysaccharide biosynthesis protein
MELREYGRILRRWWWLLLALPIAAGLISILTYREPTVSYGYTVQFSVSFLPVSTEDTNQDPRLGAVQASEYVADDLTLVMRGTRFAEFVRQYMPEDTPIGAITGATRADQEHRMITVNLQADTPEQVTVLAQAVTQASLNDLNGLLEEMWGTGELRLDVVNDSGAFPIGGGLQSQLDIPIRVVIALIAAVALAFVLDYLDDSIRNRTEAARVGRVLGEIPQK